MIDVELARNFSYLRKLANFQFVGGEFDVFHKGLLSLMAADVHHLNDGMLIVKID